MEEGGVVMGVLTSPGGSGGHTGGWIVIVIYMT